MVTSLANPPRSRLVPALAGGWSLLIVALGLWWWLQPHRFPFGRDPEAVPGPMDWMPAGAVPPALIAAGALGLVVALIARTGRTPQLVGAVGLLYALVFGVAVPGMQPVMFAGYLMAMLGPIVLFATVLAGAWRWRGGPAVVVAFLLIGGVAWATGLANGEVLHRYVQTMGGALPKLEQPIYLTFLLVGGLIWGVLSLRAVMSARSGQPAPAWTRPEAAARWGRVATVVAIACALPYGLIRMTWLTPWPYGMDAADLAANAPIRLHGVLLGGAALCGALLTYGLIARWGEVWPRWMPVVRGRPVPVRAAVVPGGLVAMLFACASVSFVPEVLAAGDPSMLLVFPFPLWAPALGTAVLGYALRRRGEQR